MTDEELLLWLRVEDTNLTDFAADRVEELIAERDQHWDSFVHWRKEADDRSEQLNAARQDAKEAEAYAEELEQELNTCRMAQAVMDNTVAGLEAKLAKAVEDRDHWSDVAGREGVCMTCRGPNGAPEPYGCTDCLNTGYCGEHHNTVADLDTKLAQAVKLIDLAVELARWDRAPKLRDDMIDFTAEIKG